MRDYHEESVMTLTYVAARLESDARRVWLGNSVIESRSQLITTIDSTLFIESNYPEVIQLPNPVVENHTPVMRREMTWTYSIGWLTNVSNWLPQLINNTDTTLVNYSFKNSPTC